MSHGKDAVAAHLVSRYGFARVGWADELKHEVGTRLRDTIKQITLMDEAMGFLPNLPRHLRGPGPGGGNKLSEDGWTARIHYALWTERSPAIRALLQEYGTQVRRADQDDYWLDAWERRIERFFGERAFHPHSDLRIVVPDTRFPNEAMRALNHKALLVRVNRPLLPPGPMAGHESETALDGWREWDLYVENVGTLADLHSAIDKWAHMKGIPCIES